MKKKKTLTKMLYSFKERIKKMNGWKKKTKEGKKWCDPFHDATE